MENYKKQIYLAVGIVALMLAAKEYGITSLDDVKKLVSPYLKALDLKQLQEA